MNKIFKQNAFTLAEVLAVLVILGVVAMMTVPSTVRRTTETANRTKILKAMAAWEDFVPRFLLENGIQDESQAAEVYRNSPNCDVVTKYFKILYEKENKRGGCEFTTSDGLLWTFKIATLDHDNGRPNYSPEGLIANVCFAQKTKSNDGKDKYECKEFTLKQNGEKYEHFIFYFHYSPEKNALYINDSQNTPWYNWKGTDWCSAHPFGHGCWSQLKEYDDKALLPWMYTKISDKED